jgi:hypothetical protein
VRAHVCIHTDNSNKHINAPFKQAASLHLWAAFDASSYYLMLRCVSSATAGPLHQRCTGLQSQSLGTCMQPACTSELTVSIRMDIL